MNSLASGAGASVTIVVTPQLSGTITSNASVLANENDPQPGDNSASETITVIGIYLPLIVRE